jgi:hypothetical protein
LVPTPARPAGRRRGASCPSPEPSRVAEGVHPGPATGRRVIYPNVMTAFPPSRLA